MHADGNIQYANYQSESQMSNYLISNGYESVISDMLDTLLKVPAEIETTL